MGKRIYKVSADIRVVGPRPLRRRGEFRVFLGFWVGGVLGGWVGGDNKKRCSCYATWSSLALHAPLLVSSLILTSAQIWSCSAADVFSHLDFRTDLTLRSVFFWFLGGWVGGDNNKRCFYYATWSSLALHAPLLVSSLILTSAQIWCYFQGFCGFLGGRVLGGWVGTITNSYYATWSSLALHAPLLVSSLILTSAQIWSCSAADVFSHLDFRTDLMLLSGFLWVFGWAGFGWVGGDNNKCCSCYATWSSLALHAPLLMSSLILTSAQIWCYALLFGGFWVGEWG